MEMALVAAEVVNHRVECKSFMSHGVKHGE